MRRVDDGGTGPTRAPDIHVECTQLLVTDPDQLRELTKGSAISVETLIANNVATISAAEMRKKLGKSDDDMPDHYGPAIFFSYSLLEGGQTFSIKPRVPFVHTGAQGKKASRQMSRGRKDKAREQKYMRPFYKRARHALRGTPYYSFKVHPYVPRELIDAYKGGQLAGAAVLVVEGEKKALAAISCGVYAVAIPGVTCWGSYIRDGRASEKDEGGIKLLHPDLLSLIRAGARLVLAFDADRVVNHNVAAAEVQLAEAFARAGADTYNLRLPYTSGGPKGLDDFIVHYNERHRASTSGPDGGEFIKNAITKAFHAGPIIDASELKPDPTRPEIVIGTDEYNTTAQVVAALAADPDLYQRANTLVRILADGPPGTERFYIEAVGRGNLRDRITRWTRLRKLKGEELKPASPTADLVRAVSEHGAFPHHHLDGVTRSPVFARDGRVVQSAGYDLETRLYYAPGRDYASIPDAPARVDARQAANDILEVVRDSPFKGPEHRSAWLAYVLTLVARPAIDGSTPMFLADANTRGSGKTFLAEAGGIIALGERVGLQTFSADPEEQRKVLTTNFARGNRLVIFDNVTTPIGGGPLNAAVTSSVWTDRKLGTNSELSARALAVLIATGNNCQIGSDMDRRVQHIRLESQEEHPELRQDWTHPDPIAWLRVQHPRLLVCALTLLRAYHVAGRPLPANGFRTWASFDEWSKLVRGAIVWVGLEDPMQAREELLESAAVSDDSKRQLVEQWHLLGEHGATAGEALRAIYPSVDRRWPGASEPDPFPVLRNAVESLCGGRRPASESQLGRHLSKLRGRRFGNQRLELGHKTNGVRRWFVQLVSGERPSIASTTTQRAVRDFAPEQHLCSNDERSGHTNRGAN